jgi:magnesium transporter
VTPEMDQEETARLMQHYRLRAIPVVEDGVLRGVITADDIIDVITEEATEDMYRIAGVLGDERVFSPVTRSIPRRLPWLLLLLVFSSFTAVVVGAFEATIADFAILAAFMPIIAGQAGNSSIQVITLVVRGLALGEVAPGDAFRVIAKEMRVGLINGMVIGVIVGVAGYLVTGRELLGVILWAALVGNMLIAGIMGVVVPLTVRVLRLDPALGSGPFVTSMADVTGVAIYLGLATIFLTDLV